MKKNKDQPLEDKCIGKNNDNSNNTLENVNEIGTPNLPEINNNIQFITIGNLKATPYHQLVNNQRYEYTNPIICKTRSK